MTLVVSGFLAPVLIVSALDSSGPLEEPADGLVCDSSGLLQAIEQAGGEPVVLTHIDRGPELLFRTDAWVIASPYHRNVDGILDARQALLSEPEAAADIISERGVDLIAICPDRDAAYLGADSFQPGSLFAALVDGDEPSWLRRLGTGDLRIYAVDPAALPT